MIGLEDISPQFMLRGKTLARRAANAAWAKFVAMLEYKAKETGTRLVYINPAYTSQTCSACGHVDKGNRVTQAEFICQACGLIEHADVNAAKDIFAKTVELIHA